MATDDASGGRSGILNLELSDKSSLYMAYMPFIENGGFFIPVRSSARLGYRLGDELFLLLRLRWEDVDERLPIPGHVVWITPPGAQSQRLPGVGIQLSGRDKDSTQQRIEALLGGVVDSERTTNTL